jgi:hypothetical protein
VAHERLIEEARTQEGKIATFDVPVNNNPYSSSFNIPAQPSGTRSAPEYVHARHVVDSDGNEKNLNLQDGVAGLVAAGAYTAKHNIDFTGDGVVGVECPSLALEIPTRLAAFSVVAPPDFYPFVKQRELMDWWAQSAPSDVLSTLWPDNPGPPKPLSDIRYPPNLTLGEPSFDPLDGTITAIVTMPRQDATSITRLEPLNPGRVSFLPDRAAGVFAPGWDCSVDRTPEVDPGDDGATISPGVTFLATYGLGSPFPEDSKLCAALSSFWPAAAPDTARVFEPFRKYASATPLTDDLIGQGVEAPWEGIIGPSRDDEYPEEVEYSALAYGDYVEAALNKCFQYKRIDALSTLDYVARTVVMERIYQYVGAKTAVEKNAWCVYSFSRCDEFLKELSIAEREAGARIDRSTGHRVIVYRHGSRRIHPNKFNKILVMQTDMTSIFVDHLKILVMVEGKKWVKRRF